MNNTAYEIMHNIVIVLPRDYKRPDDEKDADRDRIKFIFEQQPDLMRMREIHSAEELVRKYWNDPHGQLPSCPCEI
ncbi:MAG: hypothetical protein ABSB74_00045 [Tepidisphaeraceae bacterium]